jgi:two-component system, OmpR family, sensor kinase
VSAPADRRTVAARLWASRWPEAAWAAFAVANLTWMLLVPSWSMLPYHFTWMSLLLLYGFGFRAWTRTLFWCLLIPVMATTMLLFVDPAIRGLQPYDEVIELPFMVALFSALLMHSNRRKAAMSALDEVSRHNLDLLDRQRMFVQNASHQLRTPITIALAHAELLPQSGADATAASDAAIVVDELARLHGLVDQLLLLATTERHDLLRPVPTRLLPLLDDALRRWEATPRRWTAGRRDDAAVLAEPERLVLALDAILENAVQFTSDGDKIELSVHHDEREAAIVVTDSGPGIPEGQLESVFDRFEGGPPRPASHNFGLGLSIVRAVAEAHGGRVTAAHAPDGGTAVTLRLPLHEPGGDTLPEHEPKPGPAEAAPLPA